MCKQESNSRQTGALYGFGSQHNILILENCGPYVCLCDNQKLVHLMKISVQWTQNSDGNLLLRDSGDFKLANFDNLVVYKMT